MAHQEKKKRPCGITVLALFAYLAGIVAIFHTLQMLHLLPIKGPFGQASFFGFSLWGAIMWGILALIYFWVGKMLWDLNEQGWLFVVIISILNIIFAFVTVLGSTPFEAILPALLVNGIVLIYALLPGVKGSFTPAPVPQRQAAPPPSQQPAAPAAPVAETSTEPAPAAPAPAPAPAAEEPKADDDSQQA